jgi:hypothetical protein
MEKISTACDCMGGTFSTMNFFRPIYKVLGMIPTAITKECTPAEEPAVTNLNSAVATATTSTNNSSKSY